MTSEGSRVLQASVCHRAFPINLYDLVQGSTYISLKIPFFPRLVTSEAFAPDEKGGGRKRGMSVFILEGELLLSFQQSKLNI